MNIHAATSQEMQISLSPDELEAVRAAIKNEVNNSDESFCLDYTGIVLKAFEGEGMTHKLWYSNKVVAILMSFLPKEG